MERVSWVSVFLFIHFLFLFFLYLYVYIYHFNVVLYLGYDSNFVLFFQEKKKQI